MKEDTWEKLDAMFQKHSILKAEAVPLQEINESAVQIGIPLPSDYVEFIHDTAGRLLVRSPFLVSAKLNRWAMKTDLSLR